MIDNIIFAFMHFSFLHIIQCQEIDILKCLILLGVNFWGFDFIMKSYYSSRKIIKTVMGIQADQDKNDVCYKLQH